jgi:hypothetical protein
MAKCRVATLLARPVAIFYSLSHNSSSTAVSMEVAGLGVFSTVSAEEGDLLGRPDRVIPVMDLVHDGYEHWLAWAYLWLATNDIHPMQWEGDSAWMRW